MRWDFFYQPGDLTLCGRADRGGASTSYVGVMLGVYGGGPHLGAERVTGLQMSLMNRAVSSCTGFQVGAVYNIAGRVYGAQIGAVNECEQLRGVQIGGLASIVDDPFRNRSEGYSGCVEGVQIGAFSKCEQLRGVQLGLFCHAKYCQGLQIGILTFRKKARWWNRLTPFIGFGFS